MSVILRGEGGYMSVIPEAGSGCRIICEFVISLSYVVSWMSTWDINTDTMNETGSSLPTLKFSIASQCGSSQC